MVAAAPVIAVLDDEPEMRKALRRLLACHGFRVHEYESGEQLLAALNSESPEELPDCVLLDLHMPGLHGFDVLEALQVRRLNLPVIVITAHDEPDTAERANALGASAYLKKPVDRNALFSALSAVLPGSASKP